MFSPSRFVVREFVFDPQAIRAERDEKAKLEVQLKKQFVSDGYPFTLRQMCACWDTC